MKESFWIFTHLGLGDAIASNALFRHYAEVHKDKLVIIPVWENNLASIQWMLSDVPNIFFYPIETEQQLLSCKNSLQGNYLALGFYGADVIIPDNDTHYVRKLGFNPVKWDSEFYRQAGLDPELKWQGFKLPYFLQDRLGKAEPYSFCHQDKERGFELKWIPSNGRFLDKSYALSHTCFFMYGASEIHCIDSSMLNLADLMETPHCKRFVFHRYARRGLPPQLKKNWEVLD